MMLHPDVPDAPDTRVLLVMPRLVASACQALRMRASRPVMMCADLPRLGAPTALVALEGVLCMGCQNGSVLCIPQASLRAGTTEGASELKDAGGVGRLLTSLFARWGSIAPILLRDCRHAIQPASSFYVQIYICCLSGAQTERTLGGSGGTILAESAGM